MSSKSNGSRRQKHWRPSPFLGACAAVAVMALLLVIYMISKPVTMAGSKYLTIDVADANGLVETYEVRTEAQYLEEAIGDIPDLTLDGTSTEEFGLMVISVNGQRADYQLDHAYWEIACNGEPCNYGVSRQPVKNGEHYSITYTPVNR